MLQPARSSCYRDALDKAEKSARTAIKLCTENAAGPTVVFLGLWALGKKDDFHGWTWMINWWIWWVPKFQTKPFFFAISDPFSAHFCYFCWLLEDLLFQKVSGTILEGTFEDFQGAKVQTTNKSWSRFFTHDSSFFSWSYGAFKYRQIQTSI